jgi:membrane-bound lytic murein transglycosylase F
MRHVLIILLGALLSTCGIQPTLLEEVRALGELRVVTRNSPITYFIGQAGPEGPDYDLVRGFADHLGVRLKLVEVKRFGDLLSEVEAGRAQLAAAGLTVTTERARRWTLALRTSRSASGSFITRDENARSRPLTWWASDWKWSPSRATSRR